MSNATERRADPRVRMGQQRADWAQALDRALHEEWPDYGWTTYWNPLADAFGAYVTHRGDTRPLSKDQQRFIRAFMAGYEVNRD